MSFPLIAKKKCTKNLFHGFLLRIGVLFHFTLMSKDSSPELPPLMGMRAASDSELEPSGGNSRFSESTVSIEDSSMSGSKSTIDDSDEGVDKSLNNPNITFYKLGKIH